MTLQRVFALDANGEWVWQTIDVAGGGGGGATPGIAAMLAVNDDAGSANIVNLSNLLITESGEVIRLLGDDGGTPKVFVGLLGGAQVEIRNTDIRLTAADGTTVRVRVDNDGYIEVSPDDGYSAFVVAQPHANAVAALDCGGLPIIGLPTVNPGVAGTPAISAGP